MKEIILTAEQASKIDNHAKEKLGISPLVLMENAGRAVARAALGLIDKNRSKGIAVFCGKGNNAGDGFVAARHLVTAGEKVDVYLLASGGRIRNEAEANLNILKKLSNSIFQVKNLENLASIKLEDYALIIDAMLGIGLKGEVQGLFKHAISLINSSPVPVLAVDIPSGLDATTGQVHGIAVYAHSTITFVANKQGLLIGRGPKYSGKIIIQDLGIPLKNYDF